MMAKVSSAVNVTTTTLVLSPRSQGCEPVVTMLQFTKFEYNQIKANSQGVSVQMLT